ncbi:MAG TPA: hypothetical protein VHO06_11165, partial [Polyangia bacterium]|nr:hypothetical protein [Polyangia bacterium]
MDFRPTWGVVKSSLAVFILTVGLAACGDNLPGSTAIGNGGGGGAAGAGGPDAGGGGAGMTADGGGSGGNAGQAGT